MPVRLSISFSSVVSTAEPSASSRFVPRRARLASRLPETDVLEDVRLAYRRQPWGGAASLAQYFEGVANAN